MLVASPSRQQTQALRLALRLSWWAGHQAFWYPVLLQGRRRRVKFEMWYSNGILHRDDGPAYIERSRDHDTVYEIYALNGIEGPLLQNGVKVGV